MGLENIVQGHGDIILRGEIDAAVRENLVYISNIKNSQRLPPAQDAQDSTETGGLEEKWQEPRVFGWAGRGTAQAEFAGFVNKSRQDKKRNRQVNSSCGR